MRNCLRVVREAWMNQATEASLEYTGERGEGGERKEKGERRKRRWGRERENDGEGVHLEFI